MWGNPVHLGELRRFIEEKHCADTDADADAEASGAGRGPHGERLHVLVAETNRDEGTYDGIDWGGERVAEEVSAVMIAVSGLYRP